MNYATGCHIWATKLANVLAREEGCDHEAVYQAARRALLTAGGNLSYALAYVCEDMGLIEAA